VTQIATGQSKQPYLGNLEARRDSGYALEHLDLLWRVFQFKEPTDFVGVTGENHSARAFVEKAFRVAWIPDWQQYVVSEDKDFGPSEVYNLRGDASKAQELLGWEPRVASKTSLES
jgi:GDPmannose 4,6-dehydratase